MKSVIEFIDMDREELNQLVERARTTLAVADQQTTIGDLRELMA
jgi:hypothetical protein